MAIQFPCPQCGNTVQVADEHAGMQVGCPVCQAAIMAPGSADTGGEQTGAGGGVPRMTPPMQPSAVPPRARGERTGVAVASLILGILSLCLVFPGPIAVILGIMGIRRANREPSVYGGKGMAIAGLCLGVVGTIVIGFFGLISIMLPSLARARELSRRTVCSANLRSIGLGMIEYASENRNEFPTPWHEPSRQDMIGNVEYVQAIGSYRSVQLTDLREPPTTISTTRGFWTLIRDGANSPKAMICPSSDDQPSFEMDPTLYFDFGQGDIDGPADALEAATGWSQISYGIQVPFGRYGHWDLSDDPQLPLAADKGPYSAARDAGMIAPPAITVTSADSPDDWRPYNSPNHGGQGDGEGQDVLYLDGHVEWQSTPTVGINYENIYTQQNRDLHAAEDIEAGNAPDVGARLTPARNTDALIYP